jgi:hypothetical protein
MRFCIAITEVFMTTAHTATPQDEDYWYDNRHQLAPEQIFRLDDGSFVKLDRSAPGDGTKWYVADWHNGWSYYDRTIEPSDLRGQPIDDINAALAKAGAA